MAFVSKSDESFATTDELLNDGSDGLHASLLAAGWAVLDELDATPGQEDRVYESDGEDGDEALFLRMTHSAAANEFYFRAYGLWDSVNHVGYFEVGNDSGDTALKGSNAGMTVWFGIDKDGLAIVVKVGSDYNKFVAARLERIEPSETAGRTTLAAPVGGANEAGQNQLYVDADTDFSLFLPEMKMWVVNQKITSGVNAERIEIQSVDAAQRTLFLTSNLTNSYDFGALVAQSPQPMLLWGDTGGVIEEADPYGLYGPDAYSARVKSWSSSLELFSGLDQDDYSNLAAARAVFYELGVGKSHIYGGLGSRFICVPLGSVAAEDTLSFGGTGHVIFPETNKAFSLRVS
jgi:hypothetical protein